MESFEKAVNLSYVRKKNVKVILDLLFSKPYSGLELAELTDLSPAAINKILKQLLSLRLIEKEVEMSDKKTVGGQHIRYRISGDSGLLICVDFTHFQDIAVINDFSGRELFRKKYTFNYLDSIIYPSDVQDIIDELKEVVNRLNRDVYCVSLCVPGQINSETNCFIISGKFDKFKDDFLYSAFTKAFNCNVIIKNNVQMMALGEYAFGNLKSKYDTSIYIYAGYGVASCSLYKGEIISGWKGYSGEIGGNRFNISSTLSVNTSLKRILDRLKDHLEQNDVGCLIQNFKTNEYVHNEILHTARLLASDIVNMTNLIGADVVVIGGESLQFGEEYINTISEFLSKYCIPEMKVYPAQLKDAALKGGLELGRIYSIERILELKSNTSQMAS